jgi:hypothetical protein
MHHTLPWLSVNICMCVHCFCFLCINILSERVVAQEVSWPLAFIIVLKFSCPKYLFFYKNAPFKH